MCCRRRDDLILTNQDPLQQCNPAAEPTSVYRNSRLVFNTRYGDFTCLKLCDYLRGILFSRVWSNVGGGARRWETSSPNDAFGEEGPFSPGRARHLCPLPPGAPLEHHRTHVWIQMPFTLYDIRYSQRTILPHTQTTSDASIWVKAETSLPALYSIGRPV